MGLHVPFGIWHREERKSYIIGRRKDVAMKEGEWGRGTLREERMGDLEAA